MPPAPASWRGQQLWLRTRARSRRQSQPVLPDGPDPVSAAESAQIEGLVGALRAGIDPALVAAAVAAACASWEERTRAEVARAAEGAAHNVRGGRKGPQLLLPMDDHLLTLFVNKLHSWR